jgi:protein-S-isoprenylcysteine O-methyltransferase Ste14
MKRIRIFKIKTTASVVVRIILWLILLIGGAWLSIISDLHYFKSIFYNVYYHIIFVLIGLLFMKLSFHAASVGGRELAKYGRTKDLPRLETDRLVTSGIYSCMRHPMFFGLIMLPLAFGFLLGSITFIAIIAPIEMIFIAIMVLLFEEMECRKKFGKAYTEYANKVPMIGLKKTCLKRLFIK